MFVSPDTQLMSRDTERKRKVGAVELFNRIKKQFIAATFLILS